MTDVSLQALAFTTCPHCNQPPGQWCVDDFGERRALGLHFFRVENWLSSRGVVAPPES